MGLAEEPALREAALLDVRLPSGAEPWFQVSKRGRFLMAVLTGQTSRRG
ncbi:MAG TPA: hypothetical protein VNE63_14175 [Candidatus Acidoferrales bacterium]|nr:hypothetical protein [Candidatus Acidoferrales bacterium]